MPSHKTPAAAARSPGPPIDPVELTTLTHLAARLFEPLLRRVWPASGRHRPSEDPPAAPAAVPPRAVPFPAVATAAHGSVPLLRGQDVDLVRPYLVAHEDRREEVRRQRARRRVLWLAVHGVDLGPKVIHGVEVAA